MDLEDFRTLFNNDEVFTIIDKVNELKKQFKEEFKDKFPLERSLNTATNKVGLFFYYIFIHSVSFPILQNKKILNNYGYLECSSLNYKRMDRYYRIYLDFLYKHLFIIYPLTKHKTGVIYYGAKENIIKPVKIADEIYKQYSKEQIKLITDYLIGQSDDPEQVIKWCTKYPFISATKTRNIIAKLTIKYKNIPNKTVISDTDINTELNNKIIILDNNTCNILNHTNYNNISNTDNYNYLNTNNLYRLNNNNNSANLCCTASAENKDQYSKFISWIYLSSYFLKHNHLEYFKSALLTESTTSLVQPATANNNNIYNNSNNNISCTAFTNITKDTKCINNNLSCTAFTNITKDTKCTNNNLALLNINNNNLYLTKPSAMLQAVSIYDSIINPMYYTYVFNSYLIPNNSELYLHSNNLYEHLQLIKNGKYNLLDAYKLIKIDEKKLKKLFRGKEKENLHKTIYFYNKNIINEFNEEENPRYFTWFHFIPSEVRSAFMINNSYLTEAFDVHACSFVVLSKLIENIDFSKEKEATPEFLKAWDKEVKEFQNVCKNSYIYKEIADFAGVNLVSHKKMIKTASQAWLNMLDKDLTKILKSGYLKYKNPEYFNALVMINNYFEHKFKIISALFKTWEIIPKKKQSKLSKDVWNVKKMSEIKDTFNTLDEKSKKKLKYSKLIWKEFQKIELNTISKKMCNYLFFTYGVIPVTVHDALYLSEKDLAYVKQYEDLEQIFWHFINLKYYPEEQKFKKQYIKENNKLTQVVNYKEFLTTDNYGKICEGFNFGKIYSSIVVMLPKKIINSNIPQIQKKNELINNNSKIEPRIKIFFCI